MRTIKKVIIHCADTPNGDARFDAADIDRWHKARGWRKIGYHYVVDISGKIEKGRKIDVVGAHCKYHNTRSIGICMIGKTKFTLAQWSALFELLMEIRADYPDVTIHGHREFSSKVCPGWDVKAFMKHVI